MDSLIHAASDRRRLFKAGDPSPDQINPIVYGYGRPRRRRLHWIIAGVLILSTGAMSLTAHFVDPEESEPRREAVTSEGAEWLSGP